MLIVNPLASRHSLLRCLAICLVFLACLSAQYSLAEKPAGRPWFIDAINTPTITNANRKKDAVLIAIVDDGFRTTHQDLAGFIWTNPNEKPNNRIDDDGNGFVDDVHGWDVSDDDNDVGVPGYRPDFYHGTHLASIVAKIAKTAYGEAAADYVQILPVKSIADGADTTHIKDGYKGIRYAINAGADIIICSWGVGHITAEESAILREAADKGILIVSSSGNLPQELKHFPAAHENVLAVGSVDPDGTKTHNSNYGQFVDLMAPGDNIMGASVENDDAYGIRSGTSFSAAMVAAAAALVQQSHPNLSRIEVEACLLTSSRPLDVPAREFSAKLGAGSLDVEAAVACDLFSKEQDSEVRLSHSKGFLHAAPKRGNLTSWNIRPQGEFSGIRFKPVLENSRNSKGRIEFRSSSSPDDEAIASYSLDALPDSVFVPGTTAYVTVDMKRRKRGLNWLMKYESEAIDFANLYCRQTKEISVEGTLSDGSGPERYSAKSNCKWLITAPAGKVIRFEFDKLNTEARTDLIHFFDGAGTHEQIMAIFSGTEVPPAFTTWRNQVLVWFVSNEEVQGQGWRATFTFEDP